MPSLRPRSDQPSDEPTLPQAYTLVLETLGEEKAANVLYKNAIEFYRPKKIG
jgi:hypothetical protein